MQELKRRHGFTMVELLTAMLLLSILSAVALPNFLDFRRDGKIAVLRQNLTAIRVGIKNQAQQALLKCDYLRRGVITNSDWVPVIILIHLSGITDIGNDITYEYLSGQICTEAEIPDPRDRKILDLGSSKLAKSYVSGVEDRVSQLPENPMISPADSFRVVTITAASNETMSLYGGRCGYVDFISSLGTQVHWGMERFPLGGGSASDIFAFTNTPGVNECNF